MGHRANYVILENRSPTLYYSHWGARTIPADVFWGPAIAESFIRANSPTAEWLDSISAEGGIALDKDKRRAFYFGDGELPGSTELRTLFLSLAGRLWAKAGWTLEAGKDQGDLAEFCGIPRSTVESPVTAPLSLPLARLGENYARGYVFALIGHTSASGFADRVLDFSLSYAFLNGPALLPHLAKLPTLAQVRARAEEKRPAKSTLQRLKERLLDGAPANLPADAIWDKHTRSLSFPPPSYGESINGFALLDETKMVLEVHDPDSTTDLASLKMAWDGWSVSPLQGGIEGYFRRTGRARPDDLVATSLAYEELPVRSRAEYLAAIERSVCGGDGAKKQLQKVADNFKAQRGMPDTTFAAGFFDGVPPLSLIEEERRAIWATLLQSD